MLNLCFQRVLSIVVNERSLMHRTNTYRQIPIETAMLALEKVADKTSQKTRYLLHKRMKLKALNTAPEHVFFGNNMKYLALM